MKYEVFVDDEYVTTVSDARGAMYWRKIYPPKRLKLQAVDEKEK